MGPSNTAALATGGANALTITGDLALFAAQDLPVRVGVGDVIQYDSNSDGTVDSLAFIHQRNGPRSYVVRNAAGSFPVAVNASNTWSIFRAYAGLYDATQGTENVGIAVALRNFDPWSGGKDLVVAHQTWNIACYGDAEDQKSAYVGYPQWMTDATHYLRVFTPVLPSEVGTTQRHTGAWTASAYTLRGTSGSTRAFSVEAGNVRVEGLQLATYSAVNSSRWLLFFDPEPLDADLRVSHCIGRGPLDVSGSEWAGAIYLYSSNGGGGVLQAWNNIFQDFGGNGQGYGIGITNENSMLVSYNNTVVNADVGFWQFYSAIFVAKNNLAQGCGDGFAGTFESSSDHNLSDLVEEGMPGTHNRFVAPVTFVNPTTGDFHLAAADTGATNAGAGLSADPNLHFTDDIDRQARGSTWDIGADEQ